MVDERLDWNKQGNRSERESFGKLLFLEYLILCIRIISSVKMEYSNVIKIKKIKINSLRMQQFSDLH